MNVSMQLVENIWGNITNVPLHMMVKNQGSMMSFDGQDYQVDMTDLRKHNSKCLGLNGFFLMLGGLLIIII